MPLQHFLQLALTDGIGPILARRLIQAAILANTNPQSRPADFDPATDILSIPGAAELACNADLSLLRQVEGIGQKTASKIHQSLKASAEKVQPELDRAAELGLTILSPDDPLYPLLLRTIPDPPLVLYVKGSLEPRDLNAFALVGSRKCSFYGREQAERFGVILAGAGFTVVSGGARGVDSAAHRGAMQNPNGRTIAVLGCGINITYPPENKDLFEDISHRGAVVSEYPISTPPMAENFPRRNRIISGLSRGVLVIEADERSGALVTARQAAEDHNRPVFALPGRIDNSQSAGPHKLIREGAILATRLEHILEGLGPLSQSLDAPEPALFTQTVAPNSPPLPNVDLAPTVDPTLTPRQKAILDAMQQENTSIDLLINRTSLSAHEILQDMTLLTLKGQVKRVDGQTFTRRNFIQT